MEWKRMRHLMKFNRAAFTLLIGAVNAASAYVSFLINVYDGPFIAGPTAIFISAVSSAVVVYLGTEEQVASP
jgi:uncharacterized protein YraI